MTRTFLVAISYDDGIPPDPVSDAAEIEDALESAGLPVESVRIWAGGAPAVPTTLPPYE